MSVAGGAKNTLGFGFNIVLAAEGKFYLHVNSHCFDQQWTTWALSGTGEIPGLYNFQLSERYPFKRTVTYISGILET